MNVKELVEQVRAKSPSIASLPEAGSHELVREVLKQIRNSLATAPEGDLMIAGLGSFKVTLSQKEKDGATVPVRRIAYRAQMAKRPAPVRKKAPKDAK